MQSYPSRFQDWKWSCEWAEKIPLNFSGKIWSIYSRCMYSLLAPVFVFHGASYSNTLVFTHILDLFHFYILTALFSDFHHLLTSLIHNLVSLMICWQFKHKNVDLETSIKRSEALGDTHSYSAVSQKAKWLTLNYLTRIHNWACV